MTATITSAQLPSGHADRRHAAPRLPVWRRSRRSASRPRGKRRASVGCCCCAR